MSKSYGSKYTAARLRAWADYYDDPERYPRPEGSNPNGDEADIRSERQMFRVSRDEKWTLKEFAEEAGMTVGGFIRYCTMVLWPEVMKGKRRKE